MRCWRRRRTDLLRRRYTILQDNIRPRSSHLWGYRLSSYCCVVAVLLLRDFEKRKLKKLETLRTHSIAQHLCPMALLNYLSSVLKRGWPNLRAIPKQSLCKLRPDHSTEVYRKTAVLGTVSPHAVQRFITASGARPPLVLF